ncbi:MAG: hypothetical protein KDD44_02580 [Bdellovibrionales bacterium]|nr:hypothetical protein [Bdellovibrionales bacterium]
MHELGEMLERAAPWNWSASKFSCALLFALIVYAWRLVRRGRVTPHAWIMGVTLLFLISISVHGVATRGVMGTVATEDHSAFYVSVAYTHLTAGGIYFLLGISQVLLVGVFRKWWPRSMRFHRVLGRWAASLALLSISCLFFLK